MVKAAVYIGIKHATLMASCLKEENFVFQALQNLNNIFVNIHSPFPHLFE